MGARVPSFPTANSETAKCAGNGPCRDLLRLTASRETAGAQKIVPKECGGSTVTTPLAGLLNTPRGRTSVRPAFNRQVVDRLLKFDQQRADLLRREADILGDELAFEIQLIIFDTGSKIVGKFLNCTEVDRKYTLITNGTPPSTD